MKHALTWNEENATSWADVTLYLCCDLLDKNAGLSHMVGLQRVALVDSLTFDMLTAGLNPNMTFGIRCHAFMELGPFQPGPKVPDPYWYANFIVNYILVDRAEPFDCYPASAGSSVLWRKEGLNPGIRPGAP